MQQQQHQQSPQAQIAVSTRLLVPSSSDLIRAMSSENASANTNASGLTPVQSRKLTERKAKESEKKIVAAIKEMYSCKPKKVATMSLSRYKALKVLAMQQKKYDVYADNAVFKNPVGTTQGSSSIEAQFDGMTNLFERTDVPRFRVLQNPANVPSSTILIDQDVAYYRKKTQSSPTKTLNSLLTIQTNDDNKVVQHIEEWNHKSDTSRQDGFLCMLKEHRRKLANAISETFAGREPHPRNAENDQ